MILQPRASLIFPFHYSNFTNPLCSAFDFDRFHWARSLRWSTNPHPVCFLQIRNPSALVRVIDSPVVFLVLVCFPDSLPYCWTKAKLQNYVFVSDKQFFRWNTTVVLSHCNKKFHFRAVDRNNRRHTRPWNWGGWEENSHTALSTHCNVWSH